MVNKMYISVQNVFYSNEQPTVLKVDRGTKHINHREPSSASLVHWTGHLAPSVRDFVVLGARPLRCRGLHQSQGQVKYPHMFLHSSKPTAGPTLPSHHHLPPRGWYDINSRRVEICIW